MSNLTLAYIGLDSPNPAALERYLVDIIGLMPGVPLPDGSLALRNDGKSQRLTVRQAAAPAVRCVGWEAPDAATFDATVARLQAAGATIVEGGTALAAQRRAQRVASFDVPLGVRFELCLGLEDAATPFASPFYPDGFVTGAQGFGHFVLATADQTVHDATLAVLIDGLGLKKSDWLRMPMGPVELRATFLHCNPRHHSLALALVPAMPGPMPLHHINIEVADVGAVGAAYERVLQAKAPIANTIGQHDNDAMISFYAVTPDGWMVEIGATGRTITPDWNDVREYDRISRWGHQPPAVLKEMWG